jgi:hypothetical protein
MSSAASTLQNPMLSQLLVELDRIEPRTRVAVTGLPEAKFREMPPDGGWSVADVFEHLCLTNDSYLDGPLGPAIERAKSRGRVDRPWRPSFVGGWLTGALVEGSKPLPAPRRFRPVAPPRAQAVDAFLAGIARVRTLMREVDGYDLRVGLASPASPLVRINLGDAFRMLVVHSHRHLAQAERTRRAVGM